jgi:hypothetical protein
MKRSLSEAKFNDSHLSDAMQEDNDDMTNDNDDMDVTMAASQCKRLKLEDGGIRKVTVQVSIPLVSNVSLLHHHHSLKRPHSFMSGEATAGTSSVWEDSYSVFSNGKDTTDTGNGIGNDNDSGNPTMNYPLSSLSLLPQAHPSSLEDEGDGSHVLLDRSHSHTHADTHSDADVIQMESCETDRKDVNPIEQHAIHSESTETLTHMNNGPMMPMNQYLGTLHLEREERSSRKRMQQEQQQQQQQQQQYVQQRNEKDYIANDIPPYYTSSQNSMSSVSQGQGFMSFTNQDLNYANHYASSASLSSSSSSSGNATDEGVVWTPLGHRNDERRTNDVNSRNNNSTQRQNYQSQLPSDSNLY